MYLSCLLIDVGENPDRPRPGRHWLRNRHHVHQRLCMAFPSASRLSEDQTFLKPFRPDDFGDGQVHVVRSLDAGFLYRIDPQPRGRVVVLVQSAVLPSWDYAFHNAGYLLAATPQVKSYEPRFTKGQHLRFRLMANPTRKIDTKSGPDGQRRRSRRVPVSDAQLFDWLNRRAERAGFAIAFDSTTAETGYIYFNRKPDDVGQHLRSVRYNGVLAVTDAARLHDSLVKGIGPGKAYGFGLLSVAPVRG